MDSNPVVVAMWSGPRNISTAMMRSFDNRGDAVVVDEPFYACYLRSTGIDHPGRDEIIREGETDPDRVIASLTGPVPPGTRVFYQKHMAQHMLPAIDRSWFDRVRHAFLIRDPLEVLISYTKKFPRVTIEETGLPVQVEIFRSVRERTGRTPPVIDARDVLTDPRGILSRLCAELAIDFRESMLAWPPGPRETDGIWARHWYGEVEKTSSFSPLRPGVTTVPEGLRAVHDACRPHYEELLAHRIRA